MKHQNILLLHNEQIDLGNFFGFLESYKLLLLVNFLCRDIETFFLHAFIGSLLLNRITDPNHACIVNILKSYII